MVFGKVNTDEEPQLAAAFEIQSIPTLMMFRDRVLLFRQAGALPPAALADVVAQAKALDMEKVRAEIAEHEAKGEGGEGTAGLTPPSGQTPADGGELRRRHPSPRAPPPGAPGPFPTARPGS